MRTATLAFFCPMRFARFPLRWARMTAPKSRTQLIRDVALATGKTCIACGANAVTQVGDYPVCERHRHTVHPPDPRQRWKKNVRDRHGRFRTRGKVCQRCGRKGNLTRHHDWADGTPGHPPRPVILCKRCHSSADKEVSGDQQRAAGHP